MNAIRKEKRTERIRKRKNLYNKRKAARRAAFLSYKPSHPLSRELSQSESLIGAYLKPITLGSHKRIELIRFGRIDFLLYFAKFLLNIHIFLEKLGSSMKKSIPSKLLLILRRINFRWILPWRVAVKFELYKTWCDERR